MIDVSSETLRTLPEAAKRLPRRRAGRPTNTATLYRWIAKGVRGVRLEAIRLGGGLVTSDEALQRFAERLTAPGAAAVSPTARRKRAIAAAERECDARGVA